MNAQDLKEQGIDLVMGNNQHWKEKAYELFPGAIKGKTDITGEDLRLLLLGGGLWEPTHHNAWGGLMHGMASRRLYNTGKTVPMRTPKSHARRTSVYTIRPEVDWVD